MALFKWSNDTVKIVCVCSVTIYLCIGWTKMKPFESDKQTDLLSWGVVDDILFGDDARVFAMSHLVDNEREREREG